MSTGNLMSDGRQRFVDFCLKHKTILDDVDHVAFAIPVANEPRTGRQSSQRLYNDRLVGAPGIVFSIEFRGSRRACHQASLDLLYCRCQGSTRIWRKAAEALRLKLPGSRSDQQIMANAFRDRRAMRPLPECSQLFPRETRQSRDLIANINAQPPHDGVPSVRSLIR